MFSDQAKAQRFFATIVQAPRLALLISLVFIVAAGSGLTRLVKDTSVEAFVPPGHSSLVADEKAERIFGLSDPIAVAIVNLNDDSMFSDTARRIVEDWTESIRQMPNIRQDRVSSIATESSIAGDGKAINVEQYLTGSPEESRARWAAMPPHIKTLVSSDTSAIIVLAEVEDEHLAVETYQRLQDLATANTNADYAVYVAGPAAISGYLSQYIDADARKLQPLVFLLVFIFIYLAFRRFRALPGPLMLVIASAGGALGMMAWLDIPYFAITSALPVIIVAISVADAIHILSAYYRKRARQPDSTRRDIVVEAMAEMARPITLTTLTTIAGFVGIAVVSIMPPITYFAWIAALGVFLAWVSTLFALPNLLMLLDPGLSPAIRIKAASDDHPLLKPLLAQATKRSGVVTIGFLVLTVLAVNGTQALRFDRSQVENFTADEPIRIADDLINERFSGTSFLDIIIETDEEGGLLSVARMQKIVALQEFFETLPHVTKTVSIADYISLLHHAVDGSAAVTQRSLPVSDDAIAQYLFLYEISGDPSDLDEEIDPGRQFAMLRGLLDSRYFSENRPTVEALQGYLQETFNEPGMRGSLSGNVNVSYHWMSDLEGSHFKGVGLSLLLVLATSILVFRSLFAGVVAVLPVLLTILTLYAVMGYLGIYIEPATSMFAAIALGVGVDFAIHIVDRIETATKTLGEPLDVALRIYVPPVARACFFNSAALGVGFAVLLTSDLPTLQRFGGLISIATLTSYLTALLLVPALYSLRARLQGHALLAGSATVLFASFCMSPVDAYASDAQRIAEAVAARPEAAATVRDVRMQLIDKRGREKERVARIHKLKTAEERRTRVTFIAPKRYRNQAFLSRDVLASKLGDMRWMFLPAVGAPRTLSAASRGRSFFGTDFSFEDVQSELKFDLADYTFFYQGESTDGERVLHRLTGSPRSSRIARELKHGGFTALVDEATWMPVEVVFRDERDGLLKTITVHDIQSIDGIWTAMNITAVNHKTGHQTRFIYDQVTYPDDLPKGLLVPENLERGLEEFE